MKFKFFGKKKCLISTEEKKWVESNIIWIDENIEKKYSNQFSIKSFDLNAHRTIDDFVFYLTKTLEKQFDLSEYKFKINWIENPYKGEFAIQADGDLFEKGIEKTNNSTFEISLSEDLKMSIERLAYALIICFTEAYYISCNIEAHSGEDKDSFLLLSAIYFGYGAILSHGLNVFVINNDFNWTEKRTFEQHLFFEEFSYALAFLSLNYNTDDSDWLNDLSKEIKKCYIDFKDNR